VIFALTDWWTVAIANRVSYSLKKQLSSRYLGRQTKCTLYKTLVRPILTYGSESWPLTRKDVNILRIFERRILRRIYGPVKENDIWKLRYNHELYKLYNELDTVKVIKVGRLRWLGHLYRTQAQNPCRKSTLHKPDGNPRAGRPAVRWLDSVEEDLKTMGVRNWRRKTQDRDQWRAIVKETKVHHGL
jgi:hypothetical protein